ncbi:glycerol-3-phosphate 1-O-acyltransferase PlsY [Irregularibacter muris]|uniref:Glycerol-3-phosphate acyltransferase n=1 Tax=Irregularibacter muris TaxID=1796619 RepID=A0AAE3HFS7_9FIRM|nr:glycerol-3-phosphate 1-O-acyltransferase PlsY [Irregularibacter muris]MCR1899772.1 glycerol-3-phosphate 1-O-acyltransferase PlsY [Irregularibacter muris]
MQNYFIWIIIAYFIGNFATSYLTSKMMGKIDIREHGSGNAGATNVLRVLGVKAALITFIGDALKGAIVVLMVRPLGHAQLTLACGLAVIIGHNFPLLLKFKGGKGIATSIGVFLVVDPLAAAISVGLGMILIVKSKYVSLGSITGMASLPFVLLILRRPLEIVIFGLLVGLLAVYQHRTNINRLLKGTENKIGSKRKK